MRKCSKQQGYANLKRSFYYTWSTHVEKLTNYLLCWLWYPQSNSQKCRYIHISTVVQLYLAFDFLLGPVELVSFGIIFLWNHDLLWIVWFNRGRIMYYSDRLSCDWFIMVGVRVRSPRACQKALKSLFLPPGFPSTCDILPTRMTWCDCLCGLSGNFDCMFNLKRPMHGASQTIHCNFSGDFRFPRRWQNTSAIMGWLAFGED